MSMTLSFAVAIKLPVH